MRSNQAKVVCGAPASDGSGERNGTARTRGLDFSAVDFSTVDFSAVDFSAILAAHGASLYARALWLTKTRSDAADLLQDTWERALRSVPRAIAPDSILRWLLVIMHNRFLDDRRAQMVRRCVSDGDLFLSQLAADDAHPAPLWRTIDDDLLAACIARLPAPMQDILRLRAKGASYAALSLHLHLPINTVGTRLLRIRARLQKYLREALNVDAGERPPSSGSRRRMTPGPARPRLAVTRLPPREIA